MRKRDERVHLQREVAVRRRHEHPARDAAELVHEPALALTPTANVLDHGVREREVELTVAERKLAPVGLHGPDCRERGPKAIELGDPDTGDLLRPRVASLEEVVGRAATEWRVGDSDVDHRRRGPGLERLEEEPELPLAAPHGHPRRDPA